VVADNRAWIKRVHPNAIARVREILAGGEASARAALQDISGLEVLDPHQIVNVAAMTVADGFGLCVFDEQGAGKTVTLIFAFDVLVARDEVDLAIIVAPKSMVPEWPQDFARFKGDMYRVEIAAGTRRAKREALGTRPDVIVTNFETIVSMESEFRSFLAGRRRRAMLVVDESFYAKSLDAKRTRALRRLREYCARAFVLCGTPAPNSPKDLVQQFNVVDFGTTFEGVSLPEERDAMAPVVTRAIEERGVFARHLKADVLPSLPVKRFHRVLVPMERDQRRLYEGALKDLIVDLDRTDEAGFRREFGSFLARRSALIQVCSNPRALAPTYSNVPAKISALDGVIPDLIRRREKLVLWSFYTASIDALCSRYERFGVVRYDGSVSEVAERREAVRRFQQDDETMVFVGNPAAAGAGLTLHRGRYVIYESMSNQAAHYLQSLDRVHRRGQTRDVEYMILLCQDSIEIAEYERLLRKEHAAQALLGDVVDEPVTRESMLAELTEAHRLLEGA
jgi:SNF2 family DNA or RNA helicase